VPAYFFPESRDAAGEITRLFDFVWLTAVALWNLRWQVKGYVGTLPESTPERLAERFVQGSDLQGVNLKRSCIEITWEEQKSRFASIILTNAFAAYESWADRISQTLQRKANAMRLQFPNSGEKNGHGLEWVLSTMTEKRSKTLEAAFYPVFIKSTKYSLPVITNMMLSYRYFKEIRNCEIHHGGVYDKKAQEAYEAFLPTSDKKSLGMKGDLFFEPVTQGARVKLHLRGVVGFCDILLRVIATVDAELSRSSLAEVPFKMWMIATKHPKVLSGNVHRRNMQVTERCRAAGLPRPQDVEAAYEFLRAHRVIHI
jgi:hypothetical protein